MLQTLPLRAAAALAVVLVLPIRAAEAPKLAAPPSCDRVLYEISHGQYTRALTQLSGIPTAGRSEAEQANLRGLAQMMEGSEEKAVASFDLALDADPALAEARVNRAIAWMRQGEFARASRDLEALASDASSPLQAVAAYHEALAADAMGRGEDAAAWVARALARDPSLDAALLFSGVLAERRGDLQAAGRAYKSYLERHPESLVAALRFGITAQRGGFIPAARQALEGVVARAPDSPEAVEARKFLVMWSE